MTKVIRVILALNFELKLELSKHLQKRHAMGNLDVPPTGLHYCSYSITNVCTTP